MGTINNENGNTDCAEGTDFTDSIHSWEPAKTLPSWNRIADHIRQGDRHKPPDARWQADREPTEPFRFCVFDAYQNQKQPAPRKIYFSV